MLKDWRKRRELRHQIDTIQRQSTANMTADMMMERAQERTAAVYELEALLSKPLTRKAKRMNLEIPDDRGVWNMEDSEWGEHRTSLNEDGRVTVKRLISDERRKRIEWWVKVMSPIFAFIVSILGLLVAILSLLKK